MFIFFIAFRREKKNREKNIAHRHLPDSPTVHREKSIRVTTENPLFWVDSPPSGAPFAVVSPTPVSPCPDGSNGTFAPPIRRKNERELSILAPPPCLEAINARPRVATTRRLRRAPADESPPSPSPSLLQSSPGGKSAQVCEPVKTRARYPRPKPVSPKPLGLNRSEPNRSELSQPAPSQPSESTRTESTRRVNSVSVDLTTDDVSVNSARDSTDRSSAQPGSSRSVQPRHPVITRSQTAADRDTDLQCSPDQAGKSLWTQVPTLRPRINPYGPEVTPRVAPTPIGPRTTVFTVFPALTGTH
ncbi:hypothetical protein GQ457_07G005150 [Hibiscus cannabinus]